MPLGIEDQDVRPPRLFPPSGSDREFGDLGFRLGGEVLGGVALRADGDIHALFVRAESDVSGRVSAVAYLEVDNPFGLRAVKVTHAVGEAPYGIRRRHV